MKTQEVRKKKNSCAFSSRGLVVFHKRKGIHEVSLKGRRANKCCFCCRDINNSGSQRGLRITTIHEFSLKSRRANRCCFRRRGTDDPGPQCCGSGDASIVIKEAVLPKS